MSIGLIDIIIILVYLCGVLGFGFFISRNEGSEGYFVNNRKTKLWFLVFSALSTSVGAGTVLGVASAGFSNGISFAVVFAIATLLAWWLLGYLAPRIKVFGDRTKAYTFNDYLAHQYSGQTRVAARYIVLIAYFFATAIQFVAFAQLINVTTSVSFLPALFIVALITIAYTVMAGVKGDFYTDALQFFVMLTVFIFLLIKGFGVVGIHEIFSLPKEYFNVYSYSGPLFFWGGLLFGFPLMVTSTEAWQRVFAATSGRTARRAFYISGILKVVIIATALTIGFLAFHIVPDAPVDGAMFALMQTILPSGLLGLGFASMLAIIMSSVDTGIMVGSATITKDFYLVRKKDASEKDILRVGRLSAALFGLLSLLVALIFRDIITLAVISVQALIVFGPALLGGLIWNVTNKHAGFWSITLGFLTLIIALIFDQNLAFVPATVVAVIAYLVPLIIEKRKART